MKRLLAFLLMVVVVFVLHFTYGCTAVSLDRQRHTEEIEFLNLLEEQYMMKYKEADFYTQVQWRYRISPQIGKARLTLFSWDVAIACDDLATARMKEQSFLIAKDRAIFSLREVIE